MNIKFVENIILLFLVFLTSSLCAQQPVEFSASTDAKQVVVGGYFEVGFTLKNAQGKDFQPPSFKDFNLLSGPNQSISTSSFNGKWTRSLTYTYNLQPKKIGKFTIPSASITADGKKLMTKPLRIEVVKGKNNTVASQEELEEQIETQIYIEAIPSSIEAKVGEQIILDYKIYTTKQVESYNPLNELDYAGFFAEDLRSYNSQVLKEVIDGVQYSTKIIKKVALFPQQAGVLEIPPLRMQVAVASPNQTRRRRSIFSYPDVIRIQVATKMLNINVRELPDNPPASFSGAVGHYSMEARTNSRKINTNDAFSLQLSVSGDGDLKLVQAPDLMLGDSFEIFDTKVVAENALVAQQGRFVGKKVFDYLITPKYPGQFKLKPKFTYYDVDSLRYITLVNREPLAISIAQGDQSKAVIPKNQEATATLKGIMKTANWQHKSTPLFGSPIFFILLGLPLLLLGGAYFYKQRQLKLLNVDTDALRRQHANKVALKRLETANSFLKENKSRQFYDEVSRAMLDYVSDKLNIPFSKMSKDNVRDKLLELKVSETPIQQFIHVIKTSEMALFAGKDNSSAMQEVYQQAVEVVSGVEAELIDNG